MSHFWPLKKWVSFFEAAGAVAKIGSSLNQTTLSKFNQVKLFQISDKHWRTDDEAKFFT